MITNLIGTEYAKLCYKRKKCSHKGDFGTLALVCGCKNYQGAATFSTLAALHTGIGIAVSFIPDDIYIPFASKISGAVIETLECKDGMILDPSLASRILSRKCTAVLIGSGLGLSKGCTDAVSAVSSLDVPAVFDGDALSILSDNLHLLNREAPTILTPHIGEFSKLSGLTCDSVRDDRFSVAKDFAVKYNVHLVLKDYITTIADPFGNVYTFSNPTSALSKGGSGDVLAGMIASFLAQGMSPLDSCICAVTLHNACGKLCEKKYGCHYTQPENIIETISQLLD